MERMEDAVSQPEKVVLKTFRYTPYGKLRLDYLTALNHEDAAEFDGEYLKTLSASRIRYEEKVNRSFRFLMGGSAALILILTGLVQKVDSSIFQIKELAGLLEVVCFILSFTFIAFTVEAVQFFGLEYLISHHIQLKYDGKFSKSFLLIKYLPNRIFAETFTPRRIGFKPPKSQYILMGFNIFLYLIWVMGLIVFVPGSIVWGIIYSFENPMLPQPYSTILNIISLALIVNSISVLAITFLFKFNYTDVSPEAHGDGS